MPESDPSSTNSSTPILDSGLLPPRVRKKRWGSVIIGFLIGIVPGVLLIVVGRQANSRIDPGLALLSFFLVLTFAVVVHELAHLLVGWVVGFRFSLVQIGPLSLHIERGVLRARFRREMATLGYAGMHVNRLRRLRRRMLIFVAAGPIANLLSVPAVVLLVNQAFPQLGNSWVATPAAQFAFISLLFGVVSLMPLRSIAFSDGARIAMLLRSRARTKRWLSIAAIGNVYNDGIRAKNWKRTWLRSAASVQDASLDAFTGDWLAYISANDRKDVPIAATHLESCLELVHKLPLSTRDLVAQEAAVFTAWFRDDASLGDQWLTQVKKPRLMQRLVQIRLDVALRCAHRDYDAADLAWRDGITFIERSSSGTARERLKESWLEWQAEIQDRKAQQSIVLAETS
jgi:hypothetical protein